MNLLIDIDGTIHDCQWSELVKKFYDAEVANQDIRARSLEDVLGVSSKSLDDVVLYMIKQDINPIDGALGTLNELVNKGHDVYIYSKRTNWISVDQLHGWLRKSNVRYTGIYHHGSVSLHTGHAGFSVTPEIFFDVHIDDSPKKLMDIDCRRKILFNQPWNSCCLNVIGKLRIVNSWNEIRERLLMTQKVYIAGPLFNEHERRYLEVIDSICRKLGYITFLPHRDLGENAKDEKNIIAIFNGDTEELLDSDIIVALLDGQDVDSGTSTELGIAYQAGIKALGITTDFIRRAYSNAMPFGVCEKSLGVVYSLKELEEVLSKYYG